jgi:hypothetical protein
MATAKSTHKINLSVECCRELLALVRQNRKETGKPLSAPALGYLEAFAAAGMDENRTEGQLPIAIRCSPVTRRIYLQSMAEGLGHPPTADEVLSFLAKPAHLQADTMAALHRDVQSLSTVRRASKSKRE